MTLPPPEPEVRRVELSLAPGQHRLEAVDGDILELVLPASSEPQEYRVAIQSASRTTGAVPVRIAVEGGTAGGGALRGSRRSQAVDRELLEAARGFDLRHRIRRNAFRELERRGARAARGGPVPEGFRLSLLPSNSTPQVGDTLRIRYPVLPDGSVTCDTTEADTVVAEVKAVGQRAAMVEDVEVDDLASQEMNYDSLAQVFDDVVFGTDVAYFGSVTDIDGNGRILVLFTPEVNRLTEPGENTFVAGFFVPTDLADSGDPTKQGSAAAGVCPAGNEAELLYLLAPDPQGAFGDTVSVAFAKRSASGTSAHEFQHLQNTANRVIKQPGRLVLADQEESWLDEGLSHIAEEVVGLAATGDPVKSNLTLADVTEQGSLVDMSGEVDEFNTFHLPNFGRLQQYFRLPSGTRALSIEDPAGEASLRMRGFGWIFLRWLADQETSGSGVPPNSGEEGLFRALAKADGGGLSRGIANVEEATGRSWEDLLADFGAMPAVDDQGPTGLSSRLESLTWNLPDVFRGLHENQGTADAFPQAYPLAVATNGFTPDTLNLSVEGSTQGYAIFEDAGVDASLLLRVTNQAGDPLTAGNVRLLVVRIR